MTHDINLFIDVFSKGTGGLPDTCLQVIDWPKVLWGDPLPSSGHTKGWQYYLWLVIKNYREGKIDRGEYKGFYRYTLDEANNPTKLPPASAFHLEHGIHYRVATFDEERLPMRNMPKEMQKFLEALDSYRKESRAQILKQIVADSIKPDFLKLLENYTINTTRELVVDKNSTSKSAREFRDAILKYLKEHPTLWQQNLHTLFVESILNNVKVKAISEVLNSLGIQLSNTQDLLHKLSFKQGTARLYKFIKPGREKTELEAEINALNKQLETLELAILEANELSIESKNRTLLINKLQQALEQLKIAKQTADILLMYMKEDVQKADQALDALIGILGQEALNFPNLDKNLFDKDLLLNRAYNLKAKIAALSDLPGHKELAENHYKEATKLLPNDAITWNNYGGLLTDRARAEKRPDLHLRAYQCYNKAYPYLKQIKGEQRPIVYSGMAYGFILLAQCIEQKQIEQKQFDIVPGIKELRTSALSLLKKAVKADPKYINARIFTAILLYDQGKYDAALVEIDKALDINPGHPTALMRKGYIMDKLGDTIEALHFLKRAREKGGSFQKEIDTKIKEIKARK